SGLSHTTLPPLLLSSIPLLGLFGPWEDVVVAAGIMIDEDARILAIKNSFQRLTMRYRFVYTNGIAITAPSVKETIESSPIIEKIPLKPIVSKIAIETNKTISFNFILLTPA
ncbi:MAG: hypothetical protein J7L96_04275, partial [Bacteroidales bacterium]|nr:hypothetical protein [Bacteroidales bacterium]